MWREHVPAAQAFLAISSQWRTAVGGMGQVVRTALDYGAAEAGLRLAGITVTPALWGQIRVIEAGAIEALNEG